MAQDADVGLKCIKYMLFTTNFLFAMIGFLLISVGSTITAIYGDFELFMETHYFSPATLLIAIGVIIFFVSLFGCFGAIRKSVLIVNFYALLLAIILVLEISAAGAAYTMRSDISNYIEKRMENSMQFYAEETYEKSSWDFLQQRLQCCGIHNSTDWQKYLGQPPESCNYYKSDSTWRYQTGCLNKLTFIVSECASLVGTGGLCLAVVQLLGVVFALMLAKSIRRLKTEAEMQRQENQRFYAQLAKGNNDKPTPVLYMPQEVDVKA